MRKEQDMCVDLESAHKHARRIKLKNRFHRNGEPSDGRMMLTRRMRGRIHVPTVLAAVEADVIDAIDHEELVSCARIPRTLRRACYEATDGTAEAVLDGADLQALHMQRKREQERQRREFVQQFPYAFSAA